ncbi:hypothetical protein MMC10_008198 [Thelotrema lepadinum]|nr:hypothetical protein [Thelotrema lepadinum]
MAGLGGNYSITGNEASNTVIDYQGEASFPGSLLQAEANRSVTGQMVQDLVQIGDLAGAQTSTINGSILAATQGWNITLPSGRHYSEQIGVLGLGPSAPLGGLDPFANVSSILDQMKSLNAIRSSSFSLHIGSIPQGISGSMILGGYDQSRILGPVGVFAYTGDPIAWLEAVNLGAARCDSPFSNGTISQLYKGTGGSDIVNQILDEFGGPTGSAALIPNPTLPYISLPIGTCEEVASHLPVTWNTNLSLYTWNHDDPQYVKVINSSAYMEFVLAGIMAEQLSIKIPFKLLNLTLEPPLVDFPTPYFPCQPVNSSVGTWQLGRSFLQATFFGINYDQNVTLAQAPGPTLNQSIINEIQTTDKDLVTSEADALDPLISSWNNSWAPLNCPDQGINSSSNGSNSSSGSPTSSSSPQPNSGGLPGGTVAGISVGTIVGVALLGITVLLYIRYRKLAISKPAQENDAQGSSCVETSELTGDNFRHEVSEQDMSREIDGHARFEAGGDERIEAHELG